MNEERLLSGLTDHDRNQLIPLLRKWNLAPETNSDNQRYVHYDMVVLDPRASLQWRRAAGLSDVQGLLVHGVEPGGLAANAGIRRGDLIASVDDVGIDSQVADIDLPLLSESGAGDSQKRRGA